MRALAFGSRVTQETFRPFDRVVTLATGERLVATYRGEPDGWRLELSGDPLRVVTGRNLRDLLHELLEVGPRSELLAELVERLAGWYTSMGRRFACPCCGWLTLERPPPWSLALCPVCFWEDDLLQFDDVDMTGGANRVSLRQGRRNYRELGACEPGLAARVRPPTPAECRFIPAGAVDG